jgi:hypothetical protein
MSFLSLLSTLTYGPNGTSIPSGYIQTISSNGVTSWTSTLGSATGLSVSTLSGSTLTTNTVSVSGIGLSTLVGSTVSVNTIVAGALGVSTITGSTVSVNTVTTGSLGVSTITGSTVSVNTIAANLLSVSSIRLNSTAISLGLSTTSTAVNFSQGSYAPTSWTLAKSGLTNARKIAMSSTGQYQVVASEATSSLWFSSDSGVTWSALGTAQGLPVLEGSAYWSSGSVSASGQQIMLAVYGGSIWCSTDFGRTFATSGQTTPNIWLPLDGSTVDLMGSSTVTATGTPGYVSLAQPGFTERAVRLVNEAGGTASQYVRGTWAGSPNFTVSFWMNPQSPGLDQVVFSAYNANLKFVYGFNNLLYCVTTGTTVQSIVSTIPLLANTWYYITYIFQSNSTCSLYVNNSLMGTLSSGSLFSSSGVYSLGTFDTGPVTAAFNGSIADFRITNSAVPYVPVPHLAPAYWLRMEGSVADAGSYSTASVATPFIYLPFEGSTADAQGKSTVTQPGGAVSYVPTGAKGVPGTQALNLVNTAGGTADRYVRGTWSGASSFTVSFWFNAQTANGSNQQLFTAYNAYVALFINSSNNIGFFLPTGSGNTATTIATSYAIVSNTWYYVTSIFQSNGVCSLYVNNALIGTYSNSGGFGTITSSGNFALGTFDTGLANAFNGYIDDFKLYQTAFVQTPSPVPEPTIYLPLEGSVVDQQGFSTVTATGSPAYTTSVRAGALGTQAINLANTAGGTATRYVRGTWSGSPSGNFTISCWFNIQTLNQDQVIFSALGNGVHLIFFSTNFLYCYVPSGSGMSRVSMNTPFQLTSNLWYYITIVFQTNGTCSMYLGNALISTAVNSGGMGSYTGTQFSLGTYDASLVSAFNGYIDDFKIYNYAVSLQHPAVYLPFEGSAVDAMGGSAVTGTGSFSYVATLNPSDVAYRPNSSGIRAISFTNTLNQPATQYLQGTWFGSPNFTVSLWFQPKTSLGPLGTYQHLFSAYSGSAAIVVNDNTVYAVVPNGGGTSQSIIGTYTGIALNTWYYVTLIFQTNGLCSFYVNNALIGTLTNTQGVGTRTTNVYVISGIDNNQAYPFNGYIDDFRLWNTAVAYSPVAMVQPTGTMKYVPGAVGQTALWLENTAGGAVSNALYGRWLTPTTYSCSGWFNVQSYAITNNQFIFSTGGTGNGTVILYIHTGDNHKIYLQIPNGQMIATVVAQLNTWYHFHFIIQPTPNLCYLYLNGVQYTGTPNANINNSGTFTVGSFDPSSTSIYAFNGYVDDLRIYNGFIPYSSLFPANYTHLAMAGNGLYRTAALQTGSQSGRLLLSSDSGASWTVQTAAATPGAWSSLSSSYSGQYLTAQSQPVVQPNQTGLAAATWSQQGVTYTASASTEYSSFYPSTSAFNTTYDIFGWASSVLYNTSTGNYTTGASTTVATIGSISGEWLQLQCSVPLVLRSYSYGSGGNYLQVPKSFYIVGSNDGTTWYPLQYVNIMINPFTAITTAPSSYLITNYTGIQSFQANVTGFGVTNAYPTATSPYLYFRIICTTIWPSNLGSVQIGEFTPNFLGGCIMPNQSGLASSTWLNSGVSWAVSASSGNPHVAFNNTHTSGGSWFSNNNYNSSSGVYNNTYSTSIQGIGTTYGEWIQLSCSSPLLINSYRFAGYAMGALPKTYYIVGSNDGTTWYPIHYSSIPVNPLTVVPSAWSTDLIINYSGTQTVSGSSITTATTQNYSSSINTYTYFRIIVTSTYGGGSTNTELMEIYMNFTAGQNSSTNYGVTWTPTLQTGDAFNVTKNLTVTSAGTGWAQLPAFRPVSTGVTISCWFTLQSAPAQSSRLFDFAATTPDPTNALIALINSNGLITLYNRVNGADVPVFIPTTICAVGSQYHFVWTIDASGNHRAYFNGVQNVTTGSGAINTVTYVYNYIGKSNFPSDPYSNMTVRDFRMFNRALNAAEVAALYNNVNYGQPAVGPLSLSDSGQYALAAFDRCAEVDSGYLAGVQGSRWSNPLLSGIDAPIVDTAVSQSGREMVLVTAGAQNNVYYSTDFGATFTGLSLGASSVDNGVTPLARLTLDNTNVDAQGALTPATGAGSVMYSTSVVKVGTHSALFSNTAGGTSGLSYLNYTVPASLNTPSAFTMAYWIYPTSFPSSAFINMTPVIFNNNVSSAGIEIYLSGTSGNIACAYATTVNTTKAFLVTTTNVLINTWNHLAVTYVTGSLNVYLNGTLIGNTSSPTGSLCLGGGGNMTNMYIGSGLSTTNGYAGYVDDVRIYTSALTASQVATLALTPPMVSCAISNDGSYLTATNSAGSVYVLNENSTGFTLAMGNQAGAVNQGANAIAIGNGAGAVNQSANSIVLNASGSALNTGTSGFYVSPIAGTAGLPMDLLGYGSDSQVVRTGVTVLPGGNVGIGTTNPLFPIHIFGNTPGYTLPNPLNSGIVIGTTTNTAGRLYLSARYSPGSAYGVIQFSDFFSGEDHGGHLSINPLGGNVGIGTTNPGSILTISGTTYPITAANAASYPNYGQLSISSPTPPSSAAGAIGYTKIGFDHSVGNWGASFIKSVIPNTQNPPLLLQPGAGNVGIGTTNPGVALDVIGSVTMSAYITTANIYNDAGGLFPRADNSILLGYSARRWSAVWAVNGTIQTSDSNDKDSQPLLYGMNELLQVRTIKYKWKSQADLPDDDPQKNFQYYGFCADELAPLFPELVYDEDKTTPVQMNYSELLPVVVNALKEMHATGVALKGVVDSQAEQISSLQAELSSTQSQLSSTQSQLSSLLAWATVQGFSQ